jgi:hypothetical protein
MEEKHVTVLRGYTPGMMAWEPNHSWTLGLSCNTESLSNWLRLYRFPSSSSSSKKMGRGEAD